MEAKYVGPDPEAAPRPYHGRPTLFMVDHSQEALVDPDPQWGWGHLTSEGITIHDVPGDHETMWEEPHAQVLAAKLRAALKEAQAEGREVAP